MAKNRRLGDEAREVKKYAESLGYELVRADRHLVFRLPETDVQVVVSATASDHRSKQNAMAMLRRKARMAAERQ